MDSFSGTKLHNIYILVKQGGQLNMSNRMEFIKRDTISHIIAKYLAPRITNLSKLTHLMDAHSAFISTGVVGPPNIPKDATLLFTCRYLGSPFSSSSSGAFAWSRDLSHCAFPARLNRSSSHQKKIVIAVNGTATTAIIQTSRETCKRPWSLTFTNSVEKKFCYASQINS